MEDPFAILGVSFSADDSAIRKAYLNKVREFPPERDPDGFRQVRTAYEAIIDEEARLRHHLFSEPIAQPSQLLAPWFEEENRARPSRAALLEALASSLSER